MNAGYGVADTGVMSTAIEGRVDRLEDGASNDTRYTDSRREGLTYEPLRSAWPALEVSAASAPSATHYLARVVLGARRYADAARIARAFTNLVVSLTEAPVDTNHCRVVTRTGPTGESVIELRSRTVGIPSSLVVGFLQPTFEAHAAERLEQGRALDSKAELVIGIRVSLTTPLAGGTLLRVLLCSETGERASELEEGPRRFESGVRFRDESLLDLEDALSFAAGRS